MIAPLQKNLFVLSALACVAGTCVARGDEVIKITPGFAVAVKVPGAEQGKFTAFVGKTDIADITFGPANTFIVIGKIEGTTNVIALDNDTGGEIFKATLQVGEGNRVSARVYIGMPDSRGYLCGPASCVPSGVTTVTKEGEGETTTSQTTTTRQ